MIATATPALRVTKLELHEDGHIEANVTVNGATRHFRDRSGSWVTDRKRSDGWPAGVTMREASKPVALALAEHARKARKRAENAPGDFAGASA